MTIRSPKKETSEVLAVNGTALPEVNGSDSDEGSVEDGDEVEVPRPVPVAVAVEDPPPASLSRADSFSLSLAQEALMTSEIAGMIGTGSLAGSHDTNGSGKLNGNNLPPVIVNGKKSRETSPKIEPLSPTEEGPPPSKDELRSLKLRNQVKLNFFFMRLELVI